MLLGIGGALLVYSAWPVMWGAWEALGAAVVVDQLRNDKPIAPASALAAAEALDRAVQANPSADLHLDRSELLANLAVTLQGVTDQQREQWLRTAEADHGDFSGMRHGQVLGLERSRGSLTRLGL